MNFSQKEKDIIHNALLAYADVLSAVELGCEIPKRFQALNQLSEDELITQRITILGLLKTI